MCTYVYTYTEPLVFMCTYMYAYTETCVCASEGISVALLPTGALALVFNVFLGTVKHLSF